MASANQMELGQRLVGEHEIRKLTDGSTCHRMTPINRAFWRAVRTTGYC